MNYMPLYEVKEKLMQAFDEETGEILVSEEEFEELINSEEEGITYFLMMYKNALATAEALKNERDSFDKRMKAAQKIAERCKNTIAKHLNGQQYECEAGKVSWRKSTQVEVNDFEALRSWEDSMSYLKFSDPTPNKEAIKRAISAGNIIPGCTLVSKNNASIL